MCDAPLAHAGRSASWRVLDFSLLKTVSRPSRPVTRHSARIYQVHQVFQGRQCLLVPFGLRKYPLGNEGGPV